MVLRGGNGGEVRPDKSTQTAEWTVQILAADGEIVGTGFLLAGNVVCTCAHVVIDALGLMDETDASGMYVEVRLSGGWGTRRGFIDGWHLPSYRVEPSDLESDDESSDLPQSVPSGSRVAGKDLAFIHLDGELPEGVPALERSDFRKASAAQGHKFRVFGHPKHNDHGEWTAGEVLGRDHQGKVQLVTRGTENAFIVAGYSGAAVWDADSGGVIGMVVQSDGRRGAEYGVARMLPAEEILGNLYGLEDPDDVDNDVPALMFARRPQRSRRGLANAIRRNWFAARRQFFEGPAGSMVDSEGWRELIVWLRRFGEDDAEADSLRELIDHQLRANMAIDLKVFYLLAWLDPQGEPVWRGSQVTWEALVDAALPPLPTGTTESIEAHLRDSVTATPNGFSVSMWLRKWRFWHALSQFEGYRGATSVYQDWRGSIEAWKTWHSQHRPSVGAAIFTDSGLYLLAEGVIFNAAVQLGAARSTRRGGSTASLHEVDQRALLEKLISYAHPSSSPGTVTWFDTYMSWVSERKPATGNPLWWVGVTVLSRYAWIDEMSADAVVLKARLRGAAWLAVQAAMLLVVCLLVGTITAVFSNADGSFALAIGVAILSTVSASVTALIAADPKIRAWSATYRPPVLTPQRWGDALLERPWRSAGKVAAALAIGATGLCGIVLAVPIVLLLAAQMSPWDEGSSAAYDHAVSAAKTRLRSEFLGEDEFESAEPAA